MAIVLTAQHRASVAMKRAILTISMLLASQAVANAQSNEVEPLMTIEGNAASCESNAAAFDNLAAFLRSTDERLFVIARLGHGERSRDLNRRRLHNVRTYFKDGWPQIGAERFLFAEGEPISGEGRVEFYPGSKLIQISLVSRNKDICVDCCDYPDRRYYGSGKKNRSKRKRP